MWLRAFFLSISCFTSVGFAQFSCPTSPVQNETLIKTQLVAAEAYLKPLKASGAGIGISEWGALLSCQTSAEMAAKICFSFLSPHIATATAAAGGLAALAQSGVIGGQSKSCEKASGLLKTATAALAAYNTTCAALTLKCKMTCKPVIASLANIPLQTPDRLALLSAAKCFDGACGGFTLSMASAAAGIAALLKQNKQAESCQKATTEVDCKKNPTHDDCKTPTTTTTTTLLDCADSKNATNTVCRCLSYPDTPGCASIVQQATSKNQVRTLSPDDSKSTTTTTLSNKTGSGSGNSLTSSGSSSGQGSGSSAAAGSGSNPATDGSLGSSKPKPADPQAKGETKMITDVLEYDSGGGGGGRRYGGGSSSGDGSSAAMSYKLDQQQKQFGVSPVNSDGKPADISGPSGNLFEKITNAVNTIQVRDGFKP